MKVLRPLLVGVLIAGGFFYFTTWRHNGSNLLSTVSQVGQRPHLEITEAASPETPDEEEQNNIEVYKRPLPCLLNITSRAMAFDFFYAPVPQHYQAPALLLAQQARTLPTLHPLP